MPPKTEDLVALSAITPSESPLSQWTLRRKVQRREIPHVRIGNRIFIERKVLQKISEPRLYPATTGEAGS